MTIDVLLLTQTDCDLCEHAKSVLDSCGHDYPLHVSTLDLNSPEGKRLALRSGAMFPPGLLLDGELFGYGRVSERKLRRELRRRERL